MEYQDERITNAIAGQEVDIPCGSQLKVVFFEYSLCGVHLVVRDQAIFAHASNGGRELDIFIGRESLMSLSTLLAAVSHELDCRRQQKVIPTATEDANGENPS